MTPHAQPAPARPIEDAARPAGRALASLEAAFRETARAAEQLIDHYNATETTKP